MAEKLKKEANLDVIITAKETVNLLKIKFQSPNPHSLINNNNLINLFFYYKINIILFINKFIYFLINVSGAMSW